MPTDRSRRPRALHICTRFLRGGSERRIVDAIAALPEVDHQVIVGAESDLALARQRLAPAQVRDEPQLCRAVSPAKDLRAVARLVRHIRAGSFDVVYTHQSKAGATGRAAASFAGGPPTIHSLSMANFGPGYGLVEDRVFRLVERGLADRTTAFAVVGRDLARRYERLGIAGHKLHVIRSGVRFPPLDFTRPDARVRLRDHFGVPLERPLILSLGSLDARKNVLSLPRYLAEVSQRARERPFLVIAGDGPLRATLRNSLEEAGLSADARLVGHVTPVDDLVVGADVMVLLSSAEGLPQVLVQAAATTTPFVAYDVDGVAELLDLGANGTAVPLGDVHAAAEATLALLAGAGPATGSLVTGADGFDEWSDAAIAAAHRRLFTLATGIALPWPGAVDEAAVLPLVTTRGGR